MTCNLDHRACLLRQTVNRRQGGFPACTGCKTGAGRYASAVKVEKKIKKRTVSKESVCDVCGRDMKSAAKGLCSTCYAYHNRGELTRKGSGWKWQIEPPEWAIAGLDQEHVSMVVLGSVADEAAPMDEEHEIVFSGDPLDRFDDGALGVDDEPAATPTVHRGCLLIDGKSLPLVAPKSNRSHGVFVSVLKPNSGAAHMMLSTCASEMINGGDSNAAQWVEIYGGPKFGELFLLVCNDSGQNRYKISVKHRKTMSVHCSSVIRELEIPAGRYGFDRVDGSPNLFRVALDKHVNKQGK